MANKQREFSTRASKHYQIIVWITISLYSLPLLLDLAISGWKRVTSYFAADVYYYLVVARNFANYGSFTFDQEFLTNGYHPLWQIILGPLYQVFLALALPKSSILVAVFVINILLISAAIWLLGQTWILGNERISFFFILLPVGVYGLFISRIFPAYGTLWSFTNGMESALLIFLYALLAFISIKYALPLQYKQALIVGVILALIFLARLDHVFIPIGWFFFYFLLSIFQRSKTQLKVLVILAIPFILTLGLYLLINYYFVGTALPVSGAQKSTFPHLDIKNKFDDFSNILRGVSDTWAYARHWRYWQNILPAILGLFATLWGIGRLFISKNLAPLNFVLSATGLSVFLLGLYNFAFVGIWGQGHWYYPISILFTSLFTLYIADYLLFHYSTQYNRKAFVVLSACLVLLFFRLIYWNPDHNLRYAEFLENSPDILQHYRDETPKLIEFDDAIVGFSTDFPTLGGLGFTLDVEAMQAKREERLLRLAYNRGYRRLTSFNYFSAYELDENSSSDTIATKLNGSHFLSPTETSPFFFSIEYKSEDERFAIIHMELLDNTN